MFGAGLIVAYSIMLAYVSWRAASVPLLERCLSRGSLVGAAAILWVVFYVGRTWAHSSSGPLAKALELAGMTCLGALLLCSVALLAVDLGTGFGFLLRSQARTLRGWALLVGGILSVIALVQGLRAPAVVAYEVALPSLPAALDGTVLVAMSDAHLGALAGERWLAARAAQVQALQPDLIVLLGDMFEGHGDGPTSLPALRDLPAPLGKWFVTGNHEFHHDSGPGVDALQGAGFHRIDDAWVEAAPGLIIAGVSGLSAIVAVIDLGISMTLTHRITGQSSAAFLRMLAPIFGISALAVGAARALYPLVASLGTTPALAISALVIGLVYCGMTWLLDDEMRSFARIAWREGTRRLGMATGHSS